MTDCTNAALAEWGDDASDYDFDAKHPSTLQDSVSSPFFHCISSRLVSSSIIIIIIVINTITSCNFH